MLAAAALMVDYMLNVAVGISAGIGALTSAMPGAATLHACRLCLVVLAMVTLVNLRGTKESGLALALPTYLFIAGLGGILLFGVAAHRAGHRRPSGAATRRARRLRRRCRSGCCCAPSPPGARR